MVRDWIRLDAARAAPSRGFHDNGKISKNGSMGSISIINGDDVEIVDGEVPLQHYKPITTMDRTNSTSQE